MEDTSEEHADQRAHFEALVRPHMQGLFTLAWRLSRDTALAEDLVQETMLKAYRFLHRFEPGTNFRAWLITMMRNLFFSQVRKRGREIVTDHIERVAPFAAYPVVEEPDVSQLTELTAALPHLMSDDVFNALQDLPETYRTAVLLADVLEYSYKDMALTMGCPLGTVMSRLYRGRQKLQQRLQPYAVSHGHIRLEHQTHVPPCASSHAVTHEEDDPAEIAVGLCS
ncbi:MAG: sigma-70 family RNA polymerase sigma factor [Candidatus Tectomicrobia bacterium]